MSSDAKPLRIVSDGTHQGTHVIDGEGAVVPGVVRVSWTADVNEPQSGVQATIVVRGVELLADAPAESVTTQPPEQPPAEGRFGDEIPWVFPPPQANPHPTIVKLQFGHLIDQIAAARPEAVGLVEELRALLRAFDQAWYRQSQHRQGAVGYALGHTTFEPWPNVLAEIRRLRAALDGHPGVDTLTLGRIAREAWLGTSARNGGGATVDECWTAAAAAVLAHLRASIVVIGSTEEG